MARRNRAEVAVADEVGVCRCVQRVVRRAFLRGADPLSGHFDADRDRPYRATGLAVLDQAWLYSYGKVKEVCENRLGRPKRRDLIVGARDS